MLDTGGRSALGRESIDPAQRESWWFVIEWICKQGMMASIIQQVSALELAHTLIPFIKAHKVLLCVVHSRH